jgi:hypothetical protein
VVNGRRPIRSRSPAAVPSRHRGPPGGRYDGVRNSDHVVAASRPEPGIGWPEAAPDAAIERLLSVALAVVSIASLLPVTVAGFGTREATLLLFLGATGIRGAR